MITVPIIDLNATMDQVAASMRAACLDKGFLYITNHGINPALIADILAQSQRFFTQPMAEKLAVDKALSPCNRGYEPLRAQVLEPGQPSDLKEGYYIGIDLPPDNPHVQAGLFNHGPNQWPANLPGWQPVMEAYFAEMNALAFKLMQCLALSLELPQNYFDNFCQEPVAIMRLLHYPPQPANPQPGEKGCGAHTDFGALTILLQDDVGGLQLWDQQAGWIEAPPIPGSFVVNLGDLIARWTNDIYRSTLHRVINRSGKDRYSIPFFFTGHPHYQVTCLPNCAAETPKYPPTTVIGHLHHMYQRTYGIA